MFVLTEEYKNTLCDPEYNTGLLVDNKQFFFNWKIKSIWTVWRDGKSIDCYTIAYIRRCFWKKDIDYRQDFYEAYEQVQHLFLLE